MRGSGLYVVTDGINRISPRRLVLEEFHLEARLPYVRGGLDKMVCIDSFYG